MSNYETLGIFGFAWQEIIAKNVGYPVTILNASTYGGIINQQYKLWHKYVPPMTTDAAIDRIAQETGQDRAITKKAVEAFFKKDSGLAVLPADARKDTVFDPIAALKSLPAILTIGVVAYTLSQVKGLFSIARGR